MTYSTDLRWRAVVLYYCYGIPLSSISLLLGPTVSTIKRWLSMFQSKGNVEPEARTRQDSRWPEHVLDHIKSYIEDMPCFLLEELQCELKERFPMLQNVSISSICRALKFDLKQSRKVLSKRAREATFEDTRVYEMILSQYYHNPDQLVFVDETSKDSRDMARRQGWSDIGTECVVTLSFERGKRASALAALDVNGFFSWHHTEGTYDRLLFHKIMVEKIIPYMNHYPLPRSILILDNAKIHMYAQLIQAVESIGAMVIFLPPYSPNLNPIEFGFNLIKRFIQKEANLAFKANPEGVLNAAFLLSTRNYREIFRKCGYLTSSLSFDYSQFKTTGMELEEELINL